MATTWSLLLLIQEFCKRQNLPIPASVVTSSDESVTQLWGLLNEGVMNLQTRGDWPQLNRVHSFVHIGGPSYLALNLYSGLPGANQPGLGGPGSGLSASIKYPTRATLWNKTLGLLVDGPLSDQDWMAMISQQIVPTMSSWRMHGNGICIYPVPDPLSSAQFELNCTIREAVGDASAGTIITEYKQVFTLDTDICLLPADVVLADLRWRWRAEKGLAYAEHMRVSEDLILDILSKGSGAGIVRLDYDPLYPQVVRPGLLIPAGNWNVHN